MSRDPVTPAIQLLERGGVPFKIHTYDYIDRGGAGRAAECLGWELSAVIKSLVFRANGGKRLMVLMHGDRDVATRKLAKEIGISKLFACSPDEAHRATGYVVGGISPLATRNALPVYMERSILELPSLLLNAGKRGALVELEPRVLQTLLNPTLVSAALAK